MSTAGVEIWLSMSYDMMGLPVPKVSLPEILEGSSLGVKKPSAVCATWERNLSHQR